MGINFLSCHIDENDPVENWLQHNQKLKSYENWLNEQNFEYLHTTDQVQS